MMTNTYITVAPRTKWLFSFLITGQWELFPPQKDLHLSPKWIQWHLEVLSVYICWYSRLVNPLTAPSLLEADIRNRTTNCCSVEFRTGPRVGLELAGSVRNPPAHNQMGWWFTERWGATFRNICLKSSGASLTLLTHAPKLWVPLPPRRRISLRSHNCTFHLHRTFIL